MFSSFLIENENLENFGKLKIENITKEPLPFFFGLLKYVFGGISSCAKH